MIEGATFYAQTVQGAAIRSLCELIKDVLVEANLIATNEGIRLLAMDNSHSVLTSVQLNAGSFEQYQCKSRVVMGLNLANLYKLVKSACNSDVVTLWTMADMEVLHIRLQNKERASSTQFKLRLLDIDEDPMSAPKCEFSYVLSYNSVELQRLFRDMASLGTTVHITNDENSLTLKCVGDYSEQTTVITSNQNLVINKAEGDTSVTSAPSSSSMEADEDISCEFSLRYLIMFARGSNLSSNVLIYLKKGEPIILSYSAATLGKVLFCLGPMVK